MIFGIKKSIFFYPYNVLLAIATNIPMLLMTGFAVQGHIYEHVSAGAFSVSKWSRQLPCHCNLPGQVIL